jgi:hypothetical protein
MACIHKGKYSAIKKSKIMSFVGNGDHHTQQNKPAQRDKYHNFLSHTEYF